MASDKAKRHLNKLIRQLMEAGVPVPPGISRREVDELMHKHRLQPAF